jgi:heptaprenyl diphosphate synthase
LKATEANRDRQLGVLVAAACVLQVAESLLPHPLPGVRLGLANIITLVALVYLGPGSAVLLAVLRTLVSSMLIGTFLSPTFVLSFSGGVVSALVMVACFQLGRRGGRLRFSIIGISVAGSVAHIATQVAHVYLVFVRSSGVLWLWPWLALAGVVTGVLTGLIAVQALNRLEKAAPRAEKRSETRDQRPETRIDEEPKKTSESLLGRVAPEWKVGAVVLFALVVVISGTYAVFAGAAMVLAVLWLAGRAGVKPLVTALGRFAPIGLVSLLLPVLFTPWGRLLIALGPVRVTDQGLYDGLRFALRLALLFGATALLAAVSAPREIAGGLARLLSPLRVVGMKPDRLARVFGLSWSFFPVFWEKARASVGRGAGRHGLLDRFLHLPGDVVADLYVLAEQAAADPKEAP